MDHIDTVTVYLGSSGRADSVFKDSATALGKAIAKADKKLVYGGMDAGLMGLLASAALAHEGHVTGIIPKKIQDSERILAGLTKTILVEDLWDRKKRMFQMADAVISLPGGFGTLDESLEVLYWGHLRRHIVPLLLVNIKDYWGPMIRQISAAPDFDPRFLITVDRVEDAIPALMEWQVPDVTISGGAYPHFEDEIRRETDEPIIIDRTTIENIYYFVCALGLKQLGKHKRPMGIINENGAFNAFLAWIEAAERETFITPKCVSLFDSAPSREELKPLLDNQPDVSIDLHKEKWGAREA